MLLYIGTYTHLGGPGAAVVRAENGRFELLDACAAIPNPGYLALSEDGTTLYASSFSGEKQKGAAASYRVKDGHLQPLSLQPSGGADPCHICLSEDERHLYATNYASGSVSVFPVVEGYILPREQLIAHRGASMAVPDRQEAPHPHQSAFRPGTDELFVCDLGMDCVFVYLRDEETGHIIEKSRIATRPGDGPRHLVFDGPDRFFLACELSNDVLAYESDGENWVLKSAVSALPDGRMDESTVAAIRMKNGKIFVSNRGHDGVTRLSCAHGRLTREAFMPTEGRCPRDILPLGDDECIAANQLSGGLEWIKGGKTIASLPMNGAICVIPAQ